MFRALLIVCLFLPALYKSQLSFSDENIDLGTIKEAYEIKGDLVIHNSSAKKVFLMRADVDKDVTVYTSKKALAPDDTCLLVITFSPEKSGRFTKKISLISTDKTTPYLLTLSGNLQNYKANDRMACVYFGKQRNTSIAVNKEPIIVPPVTEPRDNTNKMPGSVPAAPSSRNHVTPQPPVTRDTIRKTAKPPVQRDTVHHAPLYDHKPNNLVFLVDVSSSMRDTLKLPLMKKALHVLIDAVREIDTISFVTYASKVIVLKEAISGSDKRTLHTLVDSIKAKGLTAGNKALLVSQAIAQKHFITEGNNQVILASDGEFKLIPEYYQLWKKQQTLKHTVLSTVAFGEDKKALKNLKDLAAEGKGSFIPVGTGLGGNQILLNEIEQRSRK